jgi:glycosyltransferase involved in cell wall biosynthesis
MPPQDLSSDISGAQIAVILLTLNEEENITCALESVVGWAHEIFVIDSFSTDRTVEIAEKAGCKVVSRPFVNQAEQFNWALDHLPVGSGWILRLDADEYLLRDLQREIVEATQTAPDEVTGFYMKRRMVFMGQWIRHGGYYPTWLLRLFRRGCARSETTEMDEHLVLSQGSSRRLNNDFVDHNRKGLSAWTLKHEGYAARQARVIAGRIGASDPDGIQARLYGNAVERKRWVKHNLYGRTPLFFRALLYFVYRYIFRLGILDGKVGLIFHFLHAGWYLFYVDAKICEQRLADKRRIDN